MTVANSGVTFTPGGTEAAAALGTVDSNYTLTFTPFSGGKAQTKTAYVTTPNAVWTAGALLPTSDPSRWIAPRQNETGGGDPAGYYTYQTTFTVPAGVDPASLHLSGEFAADDNSTISVNGINTGVATQDGHVLPPSFSTMTAFNIADTTGQSYFHAGVNTLDFVVSNYDALIFETPTGLRTADLTLSTPEPSSWAAFAFTGLGSLGLILRAKKRTAGGV
jgi:hypothetical protein